MVVNQYSQLPWFIKKKIVNTVLAVQPKYGLVCREWLRCMMKQYGIIYVSRYTNDPQNQILWPFYKEEARLMVIDRSEKINWEELNLTKLDELVLLSSVSKDYEPDLELVDKLEGATSVTKLTFYASGETTGLDKFIVNRKDNLIELKVTTPSFNPGFYLQTIVFNNLIHLDLEYVTDQYLIELSTWTPKLKTLRLNLLNPTNNQFPPIGSILSNLTELSFGIRYNNRGQIEDRVIELNISKFPNLTKLTVESKVNLTNILNNNQIEDLKLDIDEVFMDQVLNSPFPNLKKVFINLKSDLNLKFIKFLQTCQQLTHLQLYTQHTLELADDLPTDLLPITTLKLGGYFTFSPDFLPYFLSHLPHLHQLNLDFTDFDPHHPQDPLTLPTSLRLLNIAARVESHPWVKENFDTIRYPELDLIDIVEHFEGPFLSDKECRIIEGCR